MRGGGLRPPRQPVFYNWLFVNPFVPTFSNHLMLYFSNIQLAAEAGDLRHELRGALACVNKNRVCKCCVRIYTPYYG